MNLGIACTLGMEAAAHISGFCLERDWGQVYAGLQLRRGSWAVCVPVSQGVARARARSEVGVTVEHRLQESL